MSEEQFESETRVDLEALVEGDQGIKTIRGSGLCRNWNGIQYKAGMSAKNVGSTRLSMNVATIPPGAVAYAHIHVGFELMLYILEGKVRHEYGDGLRLTLDNEAGDFIYIEPDVPHEVFNLSNTEPVVAIVARSDASEWANIVPYDRETETVIWGEADGDQARKLAQRMQSDEGASDDAPDPANRPGNS